MLIACVCCLVWVIAGNVMVWQAEEVHTMTVDDSDVYREYRNAVYWGLNMSYEEFLVMRDPVSSLDVSSDGPGPFYFVRLERLPDSWGGVDRTITYVVISDEDLILHPVLRDLFVPTTPFSMVRINQSQVEELSVYLSPDTVIWWEGTEYGPLVVSEVMIGVLGTLTAGGMCAFAYVKRKVSRDPASRAMRIFAYVEGHQGCTMREIVRDTGFSRGSVYYNTGRLVQERLLRTFVYHGLIRYYLYGTRDTMSEVLWEITGKEKPHAIFRAILSHPGISQRELSELSGIRVSTLQWHISRLILDGAVTGVKEGRCMRYSVVPEFGERYASMPGSCDDFPAEQ